MARKLRIRLLGDTWHSIGDSTVPEDRIVEVTEHDAAAFLRNRTAARSVEILGWVEDDDGKSEELGDATT